jgi:peptidoglycan/LPS O-acetylase OafA/YrhL
VLTSSDWDAITRQPVARFEGLVVGAMLAAASVTLPAWQDSIVRRRHLLFGVGLPLVAVVLAAGSSDTAWFRIAGLLAFSIGIGLLMPLLSQLRWWASAPAVAVVAVAYLSELTYPLYLVHTLVPRVPWVHVQGPMRLVYLLASIAILFGVASALHLGIERPFLAWRDRHAPGVRSWKEPVEASQAGRDIYPIAPPAVVPVPSG